MRVLGCYWSVWASGFEPYNVSRKHTSPQDLMNNPPLRQAHTHRAKQQQQQENTRGDKSLTHMEPESTQTSACLLSQTKHFCTSHTNIITTAILGVSLPLWWALGMLLKASEAVKKTLTHKKAMLTENRQCGNTLALSTHTLRHACRTRTHTHTHTLLVRQGTWKTKTESSVVLTDTDK